MIFTISLIGQSNFSGLYSYSFKPNGNPPETEKARGPNGQLVLLKMEGNLYRFWLDVTVGWPNYNVGETDGTVTFVNDTASFDNTFEDAEHPCILRFKKDGNTIRINSESTSFNCGFGNGVNADGEYTLLKDQPVFDNTWLENEYKQSPVATIKVNTANIYQDENCLHPFTPRKYFAKMTRLLSIAETKSTIYTEYIPSPGKFIWGWIKKTDVTITAAK